MILDFALVPVDFLVFISKKLLLLYENSLKRRSGSTGKLPCTAQSVKEPPLSRSKSGGILAVRGKTNEYKTKNGVFPTPLSQLFQIHGSKFKPDPSGDGGQASVVCITHGVLLLRIREDPFNGLFSLCVNLFAQVGLSDALHNIQVFLPNVGRE